MAHDLESIVRQTEVIDEQFRDLKDYVRSREAQSATAAAVELQLFRRLLAMGAKLLGLYFHLRAVEPDAAPKGADGAALQHHSWQRRRYLSVFGLVIVPRRYYQLPDGGGVCPLDAALGLGARCYSAVLSDWLEYGVTSEAYDQAAAWLGRILHLDIAKHALERLAVEDAADVEAFYAQLPPPAPTDEGRILVVQADGKGVRMIIDTEEGPRRTEKKEAVVTAIYTIEPHRADPEAIADTLAGNPVDTTRVAAKPARPEPVAKRLRATLAGKDAAFDQLVRAVRQRDGPHIAHRVALTDGAQALQQRMLERLPAFTLILDIVHVKDYVQAAAAARLGEDCPFLKDWVACRLLEILTGRLDRALACFEDQLHCMRHLTPAEEKVVATTVGYLRNNTQYMDYQTYLANGWPIGTGVAEGGCGYVVKDRMECAGMKWRPPGAQAVLDLRTVRVNNDWDAYQEFHRQRDHDRRYAPALTLPLPPEEELLALAA